MFLYNRLAVCMFCSNISEVGSQFAVRELVELEIKSIIAVWGCILEDFFCLQTLHSVKIFICLLCARANIFCFCSCYSFTSAKNESSKCLHVLSQVSNYDVYAIGVFIFVLNCLKVIIESFFCAHIQSCLSVCCLLCLWLFENLSCLASACVKPVTFICSH